MKSMHFFASVLLTAGQAAANCEVPSYNESYKIPPGFVSSDGFEGRFDYSSTVGEPLPNFLNIDFTADWESYMWAVLEYAYEGNIEPGGPPADDFEIASNVLRNWYHPLWMHPTRGGREFLHGLTREKPSDPGHLAEGLNATFETWAVGFYNSFGASVYAKVFQEPCNPDLSDIEFPVGTVAFKLLFTEASSSQLSFLDGAPVWNAAINRVPKSSGNASPAPVPMTFLQADVAVRDPRASETGWVFGTFVFDTEVQNYNPWMRLQPVGLTWGNDPSILPGEQLLESVINEDLKGRHFGWSARPELGFAGRANGPADNLISSCVACHGTAQFPRSDDFGNVPPGPVDQGDLSAVNRRLIEYFSNIAPGEVFDEITKFRNSDVEVPAFSLDYSLLLQKGLERMCTAAVQYEEPPFDEFDVPDVCDPDNYVASALAASSSDRKILVKAVDWEYYSPPLR